MFYDLPNRPEIRLVGPDDTALWTALGIDPAGRHALVIGDPTAPSGATVIAGALPDIATYLDPLHGPLTRTLVELGVHARQALSLHKRRKPTRAPQPQPASQSPAAGAHQESVALTHTLDMTVPHDRLRVTSLTQMPTHNGVAFTANLALDGQHVGTIENNGNGGATEYHALNSSPFTWRHLESFVAQCRRRGEPVDEETVLNSLLDEFDLTHEIERATRAGHTLVRLLDPQGWCLTIRAVAAVNTTQRSDLAVHLTNDPVAVPGAVWQIWTTGGWQHVATVADPHAADRGSRHGEPST